MEVNGWTILLYDGFREQFDRLAREVAELKRKLPRETFVVHSKAKFFERVRQIIFRDVPSDPAAPAYELGNTLGPDNRHWRRAKLFQRYRLFFRFSKKERLIVYAWINDETTLRTKGARNDVYAAFAASLLKGDPSSDWSDLRQRAADLVPEGEHLQQ